MEIHYTLTEEDYLAFQLFHLKQSKTGKRALRIQQFTSPIVFVILSYVFSQFSEIPFLAFLIPFLAISIIWIIFYPKYFYSYVTRHTKKMIKEGNNEGLMGDHRMVLNEEGITDYSSNGETRVTWSAIQSYKENDQFLYLYNSSVSAYILPKRDITDLDELRGIFVGRVK